MWRVLVSMLLIFVAIAGCSLGSLVIFLLGPPFWITTVGTTFAAPVAIVSFVFTIWIAARLMRLADWILEGSV